MHALTAVPLYQQIKDRIQTSIASGEWPPGRKVPSENELVRELEVSRMTVNRALRELAQDGLLTRVAGVGTFVAEPPTRASLVKLRDIAEEVRASGAKHSAIIRVQQRIPATADLAERMETAVGHEVDHVVLVHHRDGLPVQHEERYVDPLVVPDFADVDFTHTTPSEHLLRSIEADEIEHIVEAVLPDSEIREALAIPASEPCLRLHRRTWNGKRFVAYAIFTYPGSRYQLGGRYSPRKDMRNPS